MESHKKVLVLGSGMMVEPLIDILLRNGKNKITLASNIYSAVKSIIEKRNNPNLTGIELDITSDKLLSEVEKNDLVVSYVPASFHPIVAKACLTAKKHMITSSYVSDTLKSLHQQVKDNKLIFMNEIGLDPGIDHLITYKVLIEARKRGDKVLSYESWCGSLCSPEYIDNPLLYKFAWSPKGALLALRNNAKMFSNSKEKVIPNNRLLVETVNRTFHPCFKFEGYFNRDSIHYKNLYELHDAETVIRGTIRFEGFCFIFQSFKNLNLFNEDIVSHKSWREYFEHMIKDNNNYIESFKKAYHNELTTESFINESNDSSFYHNLSLLAMSKFDNTYISNKGFKDLYNKILSTLQYLNFACTSNLLKDKTIFDSFAVLLQEKIQIKPDERDLVFMQNEFKLLGKDGVIRKKKYDLLAFGNQNGMPYSATSLLVSLPCAVTAQVIIFNKVNPGQQN
jgi:saccharopine dehydrogenase-like NADP-dependent oxidoreductase